MRWMVLAVIGAALVVNGEKAKPKADADKEKASHKSQQADRDSDRTVIVVNQRAPQGQQENHSGKPPNYLRRLFSPENLPTIALVVVGILTLGAIWYQVRETAGATRAMRESTALIERQRAATINTERPWMFIAIKRTEHVQNTFHVRFINHGRTPAEIVSFDQHLEPTKSVNELPSPPPYANEGVIMAHTRMVGAGESWEDPGESIFNLSQHFTSDQWELIQRNSVRAIFWGRLLYRDLIEDPRTAHTPGVQIGTLHETCFCYAFAPTVQQFFIAGPLGYNKHT